MLKALLFLLLTISLPFGLFSQNEQPSVRLTDSTIYMHFSIGMSKNQVLAINGKSTTVKYSLTKKRLIPRIRKCDFCACGTANYRYRHFKLVNKKGRLDHIWYYPNYGGVYVKFNDGDSVQALRFKGNEITLTNGIAIGTPQDSLKAICPDFDNKDTINRLKYTVSIDATAKTVNRIILVDGTDRASYFTDWKGKWRCFFIEV